MRVLAGLGLTVAAAVGIVLTGGSASSSESIRPVTIEALSGEQATGFLVAPGRVVTVAHVVEDDRWMRVQANGGRTRPARVLRLDRRADLALVAVPGLAPAARAARLASSVAVGSALRLLLPGRAGVRQVGVRRAIDISLRNASGGRPRQRSGLELDGAVARGDSGAALITERGEVAGVVFAHSRTRRDTAYAVDATELRRFLP